MKKLFAVLISFTLVFAACKNGDESATNANKTDGNKTGSKNNSDVIGVWTGNYDYSGILTLDIAAGTWIMAFNDTRGQASYNGTWTRDANTLTLERPNYSDSTASLSEGKLFLTQRVNTSYSRPSTLTLTKKVEAPPAPVVTTLKINNQSFTEIIDVIWNNVSFASNQYEDSIKPGTNVTKNVQVGSGYIFFKRKSNPIIAHTNDFVKVENGENIEFTFTDDTVIVEVNNDANSGKLNVLQSTVVWWDDAEGEMQPYYEARSNVVYYNNSNTSGLGLYSSLHSPINGQKAIAVGGTNTALLHLKITLIKNAKLSFWYANKRNTNSSGRTVFSINGVINRTWETEVNWASISINLEAGVNDITWEKTDGYYYTSSYERFYLSLDDILIYYTE